MTFPGEGAERPNDSRDKLAAYNGLIGDISNLINAFEAYRRPEDSSVNFAFDVSDREDVKLPATIIKLMPYPATIRVHLRKEDVLAEDGQTQEVVYSSIDFENYTKTLTLSSMTGLQTQSQLAVSELPTRDSFLDDEAEDVPVVGYASPTEFNKLLVSLAYPTSRYSDEQLKDIDMLNPQRYEALHDLLAQSDTTPGVVSTNPMQKTDIRFDYTLTDGDPTTFRIVYPEANSGRPIYIDGDLDTVFQLPFSVVEEDLIALMSSNEKIVENVTSITGNKRPLDVFPLGWVPDMQRKPYYPTVAEINYVRSLIQQELAIITPLEYIGEEGPEIESAEDTSIKKGLSYFGREQTRKILEQLSFDAPDPSA